MPSIFRILVLAVLSGCARAEAAAPAVVQDDAPDLLVQTATAEVIAILQQDIASGQPTKVAHLVETKVLPLFDFPHMTSIAVARNWALASQAQQAALTAEFRTLLVRTYSVSLSNYRDQQIEYLLQRAASGDTTVTVRSTIRRPGAERITIDYEMEHTPAGWKVYDIRVAGVSLIITYRSTFAALVRDRGVDGLISSLAEKNRTGRAASG